MRKEKDVLIEKVLDILFWEKNVDFEFSRTAHV